MLQNNSDQSGEKWVMKEREERLGQEDIRAGHKQKRWHHTGSYFVMGQMSENIGGSEI